MNTHEAKTHLSQLLDRVSRGEEIIIGRAGKPIARLVPYVASSEPRRPGAWRGRVGLAEDFDRTPADVVDAFEGG